MSLPQERVERFEYPPMPFAPAELSVQGLTEVVAPRGHSLQADYSDRRDHGQEAASNLEDDKRRAFAAGRESGLIEGRHLERESHAAALQACEDRLKQQLSNLLNQFAQERDRYLQAVEHEVVKLALAVAARILRREAQMDPLLLTGAVRVALGQLSAATEVRLRVPAAELDLWKDAVAHLPNLAIHPQVIAGDRMLLGDCAIETSLGSVDLGVRSQLGEIERGFFDRAGKAAAAESQTDTAAVSALAQA
jgi:flagellar assembly protein FliH